MKMYTLGLLLAALFTCGLANAGMQIENSSKKVLGFAAKLECDSGTTCTIEGAKVHLSAPGTNGLALLGGTDTTFIPFPVTATTGIGTSTTPSATTVYLVGVTATNNATLTGVAVNNAGTCGTNSYVVALFDSSGNPLAHSALAGTLCSGTSAWQDIPFTATVAITGPSLYFIGIYMNGTTDRFYTIPVAGEYAGFAGTVTGQTFGTVAKVTPPSTFTAGAGPIVHTY